MNKEMINNIYDIMVSECGAAESMRDAFVCEYQKDSPSSEWRISGKLGFGGKFRLNNNGMYVDCYSEDETSEKNKIIETANAQLNALVAMESTNNTKSIP